MILLLLALGAGAASPVPICAPPAPALVQGEEAEEPPDDRAEVEELLEQLLEHTRHLGKKDAWAVEVIGKLRVEFRRSGPHDRRDVVKGIHRAMRVKRRIAKDGSRQRELFLEGAKALAEMGPESVDPLIRLIDDRNHADDYPVRCAFISSLGKTKDEKAVRRLLDLLDEFQARLQASAATALGNFTNLDQKVRKRIFEDLLKLLCGTSAAMQDKQNSSTLHDRWRRVSGPCQSSMRKLSGANESGAEKWRRWWNKNKRKDWDGE